MKKTVKKTKTVKKPVFIVDMTKINTPKELCAEFGLAKQEAKLPITDLELEAIVEVAIGSTADALLDAMANVPYTKVNLADGEKIVFDSKGNVKIKKPNIFRRFWNWITRKK